MDINTISRVNGKNNISLNEFTKDQLNAYNSLIDFINSPYNRDDFKRALVGPAGVGKTTLVRALIMNCNLSHSTIGVAAPTHKACRVLQESIGIPNIKANTLQSDLGLRLNFDASKFDINNPPFDPKGNIKIKVKKYALYIVDEASMINRGLFMFLEDICKKNACKLLLIGDSNQLPPVNEKYSAAFRGIKTYSLNEIVRQGDDSPITYLLELLRYDVSHKTFKFLEYISRNKSKFNEDNTKGYAVLDSANFERMVRINFSDENLTSLTRNVDYAKVIAYTNNVVSGWNKFIRKTIFKDSDKSVITKHDLILSYTTIVDRFNSCIIKNSEEYIVKDIVNFVHPKYNFKGFMVRFEAIVGGKPTPPFFILDHKDKESMQGYVNLSTSMIENAKKNSKFSSTLWKNYYDFKNSCLLLTNIINPYTRKLMFSRDLDYGFALTSHKSQGSTFDTALVDVNDIVYDKTGNLYTDTEEINRRLYVACSRCKNKLYLKYGQ